MINICFVTGSRADYGLLKPILDELKNLKEVNLQIVATGMHLSQEFGLTIQQIYDDNFVVVEKVEMLLSTDTKSGISKSVGLGIIGFSDCFVRLKPSIVVLLGDRFEIFSAAIAAMNEVIPIAHIHGGETGAGTVDNMIRHAITKMSLIHFVSTEAYKNRVIQLGENPNNVYCVGAPGLDNIKKLKLLSKPEVEKLLEFVITDKTVLVTYHPLSLQEGTAKIQFNEVIEGLQQIEGIRIIFTKSNSDVDGRIINKMIDEYVEKNNNAKAFTSLGTLNYLSTVKYVKAVVGNSSSGITEAPSLGTYTLNIGDRQKGRIQGDSVFNCSANSEDVYQSLMRILDLSKYANFVNPYEGENTSEKIVEILLRRIKDGFNVEKEFFDLEDIKWR